MLVHANMFIQGQRWEGVTLYKYVSTKPVECRTGDEVVLGHGLSHILHGHVSGLNVYQIISRKSVHRYRYSHEYFSTHVHEHIHVHKPHKGFLLVCDTSKT